MSILLDADAILSKNEQWTKLDQQWGKPVDLDTEDDDKPPKLSPVLSSLDLRTTTFDSPFLMKRPRHKVGRQPSKKSTTTVLDYKDFLKDLEDMDTEDLPLKQFYYISGQILSALSVEEICDKIDDIFKSVEKLCSATSTIRHKKLPEVVQCSISSTDLSFDDTQHDLEKEKSDTDDVDRYIDEAFEQLNSTIVSLSNRTREPEKSIQETTVTTLVKRFSSILTSPVISCSPRRQRQCCDKFKDLADFWKNRAFD